MSLHELAELTGDELSTDCDHCAAVLVLAEQVQALRAEVAPVLALVPLVEQLRNSGGMVGMLLRSAGKV